MWMINTDYDQEFFFGRNAYFLGVDPSAWLESGPARRAQNRLFPPVPSETNPLPDDAPPHRSAPTEPVVLGSGPGAVAGGEQEQAIGNEPAGRRRATAAAEPPATVSAPMKVPPGTSRGARNLDVAHIDRPQHGRQPRDLGRPTIRTRSRGPVRAGHYVPAPRGRNCGARARRGRPRALKTRSFPGPGGPAP